jgi:hypothetical protein
MLNDSSLKNPGSRRKHFTAEAQSTQRPEYNFYKNPFTRRPPRLRGEINPKSNYTAEAQSSLRSEYNLYKNLFIRVLCASVVNSPKSNYTAETQSSPRSEYNLYKNLFTLRPPRLCGEINPKSN